jgi:hypothetical protein
MVPHGRPAQERVQAAVGALAEVADATEALHRALEQQALAQLGLQDDIRRAPRRPACPRAQHARWAAGACQDEAWMPTDTLCAGMCPKSDFIPWNRVGALALPGPWKTPLLPLARPMC